MARFYSAPALATKKAAGFQPQLLMALELYVDQPKVLIVMIFFLCFFLVIIVLLHLSIFPLNFHFFTCIALLFTHDLMHSHAVHTQPQLQSCCLHIASCTVLYTATILSI